MSFIGKIISFTFTHAAQLDKPSPSFASSAAFKAAMDTQAAQCQTAINSIIDQLNSVIALSSGAESLGSAPITGVAGGVASTVYAQLVDIKSQLTGLVLGLIPDGTITALKLAPNSVTYADADPATQTELNGGLIYAYKTMGGF